MKRFEQLLKYIGGPLFIFSIYNTTSGVLAQGDRQKMLEITKEINEIMNKVESNFSQTSS